MNKDQILILNSGNNFDPSPTSNQISPPYILEAIKKMGTEAVGLGPEELRLGLETLKTIGLKSTAPLVSANIPGFQPYILLSKNQGQTKVLITSAVDPDLLDQEGIQINDITDPVTQLNRLNQNIGHDLFIVLLHAEPQKISDVMKKCPGIDFVIDGQSESVLHQIVDGHPVVSNNQKGAYVSYLDIYKNNANEYSHAPPVDLKAEVAKVQEDPDIKKLIKKYDEEISAYYKQLDLQNKTIHAQYNEQNQYAGNLSCMQCHFQTGRTWNRTKHAQAMESLVKKSKQFDPDCLSCHTTGINIQNAVGNSFPKGASAIMTGVQCEACHGPGKMHAEQPTSTKMPPITKASCIQCHTPEKDPDFDFNNDIRRLKNEACNVAKN